MHSNTGTFEISIKCKNNERCVLTPCHSDTVTFEIIIKCKNKEICVLTQCHSHTVTFEISIKCKNKERCMLTVSQWHSYFWNSQNVKIKNDASWHSNPFILITFPHTISCSLTRRILKSIKKSSRHCNLIMLFGCFNF